MSSFSARLVVNNTSNRLLVVDFLNRAALALLRQPFRMLGHSLRSLTIQFGMLRHRHHSEMSSLSRLRFSEHTRTCVVPGCTECALGRRDRAALVEHDQISCAATRAQ